MKILIFVLLAITVVFGQQDKKQKVKKLSMTQTVNGFKGAFEFLLGPSSDQKKDIAHSYQECSDLYTQYQSQLQEEIDKRALIYQQALKKIQDITNKNEYQRFISLKYLNKTLEENDNTFEFIQNWEQIKLILGEENFYRQLKLAHQQLQDKVDNKKETFQAGSQEWEKTYPRILKRTLVKAIKDETDRFFEQVNIINSMKKLVQERQKFQQKQNDIKQKKQKHEL